MGRLCEIHEPGGSDLKPWNPKTNPSDRQHRMPVITPAFPAMNSTHNVTETAKRILLAEFRRGYKIVQQIESGTANWDEIHDPFPYFTVFPRFIWLEILAKDKEGFHNFAGHVESK